jgi:hypothetical protein
MVPVDLDVAHELPSIHLCQSRVRHVSRNNGGGLLGGGHPGSLVRCLLRHVDHGALEALDDPGVDRGACGDGRLHLSRAVEVAAVVRVERGDGRRVVRELEAMDAPASAVESRVPRSRGGDVPLEAEELVDRVEAPVRGAGAREVGRGVDGAVQLTVDVEGRAGYAAGACGLRQAGALTNASKRRRCISTSVWWMGLPPMLAPRSYKPMNCASRSPPPGSCSGRAVLMQGRRPGRRRRRRAAPTGRRGAARRACSQR